MNTRNSILIGAVVIIIVLGGFFVLTDSQSTVDVANPSDLSLISTTTPTTDTSADATTSDTASNGDTSGDTSANTPPDSTAASTTLSASSTSATSTANSASSTPLVVNYLDAGFSPNVIQISEGQTVTFYNETATSTMWVASDPYPNDTNYPEFNEDRGSAPGQSYVFTFDKAGTWTYHDNLNPHFTGTIIVQ